jgi:hypothetical protein
MLFVNEATHSRSIKPQQAAGNLPTVIKKEVDVDRARIVPATLLAVVLILGLSGSAKPQTAVKTNALWNDSGSNKFRGVWIYSEPGSCPEIRSRARLLLVFGLEAAPGRTKYQVKELEYCYAWADGEGSGPNCTDGIVKLQFDPSEGRLTGTYKFVMEDKTTVEGNFVAAYCPPKKVE